MSVELAAALETAIAALKTVVVICPPDADLYRDCFETIVELDAHRRRVAA